MVAPSTRAKEEADVQGLLQDVIKWRLADGRSLGSFRFVLDGAALLAQRT